jgi:fructokinase
MIYCLGETVYDIIFRNGQPVAAKAGGSMLNSAVSLGRCGLDVAMITELGDDQVGDMVMTFLNENHVSNSLIHPAIGFKTPVSLAFIDEKGDAHYSFYKTYPENRLDIAWPELKKGDVVLYGSFYSLHPAVHNKIAGFVRLAKEAGALTVYDPNIRRNHLREIMQLMPSVEENISLASIVRGSDEDFMNLFGLHNGEEVNNKIKDLGCNALILTRNAQGAESFRDGVPVSVPARPVDVVSTIGAGDSFNAGIIFGLVNKGFTNADLMSIGEDDWIEILGFGIDFASEVCGSYENYISLSSGLIAHG